MQINNRVMYESETAFRVWGPRLYCKTFNSITKFKCTSIIYILSLVRGQEAVNRILTNLDLLPVFYCVDFWFVKNRVRASYIRASLTFNKSRDAVDKEYRRRGQYPFGLFCSNIDDNKCDNAILLYTNYF